jgi:uncharacterized OB-fold protein
MGDGKVRQVPFKEGMMVLPQSPDDRGNLLGSRCKKCGEQFFIKREICENCQGRELEEILLGNKGKLYAFSVMYYPAPPPYKPPDPFVSYGLGWIEMPGGTVLYALLTENDPKKLKVGMDMELVFDKFGEDKEGNEIMICKFKPVAAH